MKTIAFMLFALVTTLANASVLTVSNTAVSPAQFTTIADALAAAMSGDTILVHGSPNAYGAMTLDKQLYILGPGHHPNKQQPYAATFSGITFSPGSDGSLIDGLRCNTLTANAAVNNAVVRHCEVLHVISVGFAGVLMSDWLFENNILWGGNFYPFAVQLYNNANLNNFIFRNNIFYNRVADLQSNVVFDHNLFFAANAANAFQNTWNGTFSNNIFYMMSPQSIANATFINNLTYNTADDIIPYGSNSGSGNIIGQDPLFVNFPAAGGTYNVTYDYHLQASSPGAGAGSDGTDVGPEGGLVGFSMSGEPPIPVVRTFNILNSTVPVGGQLNIDVTVTKAEDQ